MTTLISYLTRRNLLNAGWIIVSAGWLAITLGVTAWVAAYETTDILDDLSAIIPLATMLIIALVAPAVAAVSWNQYSEPLLLDLIHRGVRAGTISVSSLLSSWFSALLLLAVSLPAAVWAATAGSRHWIPLAIAYGAAVVGTAFMTAIGQFIGSVSRSATSAVAAAVAVSILFILAGTLITLLPAGDYQRPALIAIAAANPALTAAGLLASGAHPVLDLVHGTIGLTRIDALIALGAQVVVVLILFVPIARRAHAPQRRIPSRRRLG